MIGGMMLHGEANSSSPYQFRCGRASDTGEMIFKFTNPRFGISMNHNRTHLTGFCLFWSNNILD